MSPSDTVVYIFMMYLCCPPPLHDIFHTPMVRYSLFVLKVPLNTKQLTYLIQLMNFMRDIWEKKTILVGFFIISFYGSVYTGPFNNTFLSLYTLLLWRTCSLESMTSVVHRSNFGQCSFWCHQWLVWMTEGLKIPGSLEKDQHVKLERHSVEHIPQPRLLTQINCYC